MLERPLRLQRPRTRRDGSIAAGGTYEGSGVSGEQGFACSRERWRHDVSIVVHCTSASFLGNAVVPSALGLTKALAFLAGLDGRPR